MPAAVRASQHIQGSQPERHVLLELGLLAAEWVVSMYIYF